MSGTMLQKEACLIAEKWKLIKGFYASNEWLQSFNQQHNLHKKETVAEDGGKNKKKSPWKLE